MSLKINNNIDAMNGYRNLNKNSGAIGKSLERLSSGLRINRAADDAAGLVISEQLRAQISGLNRGIANTETAVNMVNTAEGSLDEMNTLLKKVRELSLAAANTAVNDISQLQADQAELDNAILSITRIAATTQFGTKKLIDGTLAGANSYDTTKIYRFDVGANLMTRVDFTPGTVSLVIDSSAETSTFITGILSAGVSNVASLTSAGGVAATSFGDVISLSQTEFFTSGGLVFSGTAAAITSIIFVARVGETVVSFNASGMTTASVLAAVNTAQSAYTLLSGISASGGLKVVNNSTGAIGAVRDISLTVKATNSVTSVAYYTNEFNLTATASATGTISWGHNMATTIKTSGTAVFSGGFSVAGGSFGDSATVFINQTGSNLAGSTMREVIGVGTNRLNIGASMTVTVSGKDYTFANNESMLDMVSYINLQQSEYKLAIDHDYGFTMVRTIIGGNGDAADLRIRVNDATGRSSNMTALGATKVEFSTGTGGVPAANDGGFDDGVNINAHLEGDGLPGARINLTTTSEDASILRNNANGLQINVATAFAKTAGTVVANLTRGALFQVGPNNAQTTAIDIKDVTSAKLGLGGDSTNTLRSLQSLVDKQALINGFTTQALNVIDKAIDDVTALRGSLGTFQSNTLETSLNSLAITQQNLTAAESTIRDTDFAKESAMFARNQILVNASTSMLAQANQLPQSVLQLIQGGR
ncbi:MAG: flagellin [Planctomycetota bacterium]